ncbi:MAG: DUF4838 domain-containing protein [Pirellulales bacterium]|nr:DUF4838 domain-containing protein [Pirellulales bacterium]
MPSLKHRFKTFLLTALLLTSLVALRAADAPRPAAPEKRIRLAENGVRRHAIVVGNAETATAAERFAAEELALFMQRITGAAFPIVKEGERNGPGIYVGRTQRAAQTGVDFEKLGEEEWVLRTTQEDLILTGGRPRGTLYAVYEFLETWAGCRWVTHDIEIIPLNRDFAIPTLDARGQPGFGWRETTLYPRHDDPKRISKEDYARFLVRNRYNGGAFWLDEPRFGFAVHFGRPGSSHTFHIYQEHWEDWKPEFFAMTEEGVRAPRPAGPLGHDFCLTNPELRDRVYRQLLRYIEEDRKASAEKGTPPPTLYALSQNDTSSKYCRCPDCSAIADREGSFSGTTIAFINDIADRIAGRYPDIRLLTEAYQFTKCVPKSIRPRENVVVRLALLDLEYRADEIADVLRPVTSPTNRAARELTEGWAAAVPGRQLFVWDYAQFRDPFRYPYDGTTKILKNLEFWHRLGIKRAFIEQTGIDLSFRPMRDWLFFRKSVHPELENDLLVREFLDAYFGPAVEPMRNYYELLAAATEAGDQPYFETPASVNPWLTAEFFAQVNAWLDEAEALSQAVENARFLRHVQLERVPVDSAMAHLWHRYADSRAWSGRKEEVLRRYEKNKRMLIQTWATTVHAWVNCGAGAIDGELAALRLELPAQFAGRNANLRRMGHDAPAGNLVQDSSAAGGLARSLGSRRPGDHKLPFQMRVHDDKAAKSWEPLTLEKVPQDETYHWHHVGTGPLGVHCGLWSNVPLWVPIGWGAAPPPMNEREVWVSLKFTGPTYVKDSTLPDQVLLDQVVVVPRIAPNMPMPLASPP